MNVVITGSTKGIGLGMAREFLKRNHNVVISSRRPDAVERVAAELRATAPGQRVVGCACDVTDYGQVETLWDKGGEALGSIDIWINNAGRDTAKVPFFMLPKEEIADTVNTNIIGMMYCNHVVIPRMYKQGSGTIFNMEGFGSNGQVRPTAGVYGATKYALRYFTETMALEQKKSPVKICYLSPGIVITDMLLPSPDRRGRGWEEAKKILNLLADTVETVTPFLVEGILNVKKNGEAVRWLTPQKIRKRKLQSLFKKRDVFAPLGL
jgi:short-subunit dehydrogenase